MLVHKHINTHARACVYLGSNGTEEKVFEKIKVFKVALRTEIGSWFQVNSVSKQL